MLKKIPSFYFLIIVSTIITILPITGYAGVETAQITTYCAPEPGKAQWIQIFFGKPDAKASLRTDGLLFSLGAWRKFIKDKETEVQYGLPLGPIMDISSQGIMATLGTPMAAATASTTS